MSRYQGHDSGESRRSPRDRSPGSVRYNDPREAPFNNTQRLPDGQHRPSIDSRSNTFSSRGEPYRDSSSNRDREAGRDFSNRDPPRAPKALIEGTPPSGPRASNYGTDNFRGHGRGRARGWRDDSRDRGREGDYYERDRRDERGGFGRGERGRDRDWADRERRERDSLSFRGRRPSSPATGRSPSLRDPRDGPIGLDVDRTRRGSRDGPLSAASSSSEPPGTTGPSFGHGYGRARPAGHGEWPSRGRGRGGYFEDRFRGRSRSPDRVLERSQNISRRASFADRSPPPQAPEIPAFGSVAPAIPTGPRIKVGRPVGTRAGSIQLINKTPLAQTTLQEPVQASSPVISQSQPTSTLTLPPKSINTPTPTEEHKDSTLLTPMTTEHDERLAIRIRLRHSADLDDDSDSESDEDYDFEAKSRDIEARLAQASLGSGSLSYLSMQPGHFHPIKLPPIPLVLTVNHSEVGEREISDTLSASKTRPNLTLAGADENDGDESEAEELGQLEAVRRLRKTPPLANLPFAPNVTSWWEDPEVLEDFRQSEERQSWVASQIAEQMEYRDQEVEGQKEEYSNHYRRYLDFCESEEAVAVNHRLRIQTPRNERSVSATPAAESRPEGRRAASRFATEHDLERVLRESERDAKEKEKAARERRERDRMATYREAVIPDMWSREDMENYLYPDTTGHVPFDRSVARLELLPPIDDFTEEESKLFEELFLDEPKNWSCISRKMGTRSYKECIQHYYEVKHKGLSMRLKRGKKRKGRKPGPSKARANALMANLDGKPEDQEILEWSIKENGKDANWRPDPTLGERRRPRRAAAPTFGAAQADPVVPGEAALARQARAERIIEEKKKQPKHDSGSDNKPGKPRNKASTHDKASKQAKNVHPLIAAQTPRGPPPLVEEEEPIMQPVNPFMAPPRRRSLSPPGRYPNPFDGSAGSPPTYGPAILAQERPVPLVMSGEESVHQSHNRLGSLPPSAPNSQPRDRRNVPQTSSYWSVPEQTDFPPLLEHYGTNWEAIANHMGSKTHIMVKNYYQRQVDSGRTELEEKARVADDRIRLGESTGPAPTPTIPIKRRYDSVNSGLQRPLNTPTDSSDDAAPAGQSLVMQHVASPQPSLAARFPSLARATSTAITATPVPQATVSARPLGMAHQGQITQQAPQSRSGRGPPLGYFTADTSRPILQAATSSHQAQSSPPTDPIMSRSHLVAHEAQRERQQALLLEEQQQARQQQLRMKQETEMQNLNQYEQYSTQAQQPSITAHSRVEIEPQQYAGPDMRRVAQPAYQARNVQVSRQLSGERVASNITPPLAVTPVTAHPAMNAPGPRPLQEVPQAPRPQPPAAVPARVKTSNIMSLLNDDPPKSINPPPKRPSEPLPPTQQTQSPAPLQSMYQQPARPSSVPQPPQIRRETSLGDMRGPQQSYPRSASNSQAPMRVVESPYSAAVQSHSQSRPQVESPRESTLPGNYYNPPGMEYSARDQAPLHRQQTMLQQRPQRQQQQLMEPQSATRSPQMGASYHATQSQQSGHRQLAFSQAQHHTASPPTQYATHSLHGSRHNSFDGRHGLPTTSVPPQSGYSTPHQPSSAVQYQSQSQHALQPSRFTSQSAAPTTQAPSLTQQVPPQHQPISSQPAYSPLPAQHLQHHAQAPPSSRAYTPQSAYDARYGAPPAQPQPHHAEGRISTDERDSIIRQQIMGQRAAREYSDVNATYEDRRAEEQYLNERAAREREFRERERARQYEERRFEESRR